MAEGGLEAREEEVALVVVAVMEGQVPVQVLAEDREPGVNPERWASQELMARQG